MESCKLVDEVTNAKSRRGWEFASALSGTRGVGRAGRRQHAQGRAEMSNNKKMCVVRVKGVVETTRGGGRRGARQGGGGERFAGRGGSRDGGMWARAWRCRPPCTTRILQRDCVHRRACRRRRARSSMALWLLPARRRLVRAKCACATVRRASTGGQKPASCRIGPL